LNSPLRLKPIKDVSWHSGIRGSGGSSDRRGSGVHSRGSIGDRRGSKNSGASRRSKPDDGDENRKSVFSRGLCLGQDYQLTLPQLTPYQVLRYKYSQGHMFCLDMLIEGHHRSFAVLFNLMRRQQKEYEAAEANSYLKMQSLLENDPQKLMKVKSELTATESKERQELKTSKELFRYKEGGLVAGTDKALLSRYNAVIRLGRYFAQIGDVWLADFFLCQSLNAAENLSLVCGAAGAASAAASSNRNGSVSRNGSMEYRDSLIPAFSGVAKPMTEMACARRVADVLLALCHLDDVDPRFEATLANLRFSLDQTTRLLELSRGRPWVVNNVSYEMEALRRVCIAHERLGDAYRIPPDVDRAAATEHYRAALTAVAKTRDRALEARVHQSLARQLIERFHWSEAVQSLSYCESTFVLYGRSIEACDAQVALGHCFRCMGLPERSRERLRSAIATARRNEYLQGMIDACFEMSLLELAEDEGTGNCQRKDGGADGGVDGGAAVGTPYDEWSASGKAEWRMRRAYMLTRDALTKGKIMCAGLGMNVGEVMDEDPRMTLEEENERAHKRMISEMVKSGGGGVGAATAAAEEEADRKRRQTLRADTKARLRVTYGVLSAVSLMPALVEAVWRKPTEDVRAEAKAMLQWKNNALWQPDEEELSDRWDMSEDDHFSIYSDEGLVGKRIMEGFEPLRVIRPPPEEINDDVDDVDEVMDEGAVLEDGDADAEGVVVDGEGPENDEINLSLANLVEVLTSDNMG